MEEFKKKKIEKIDGEGGTGRKRIYYVNRRGTEELSEIRTKLAWSRYRKLLQHYYHVDKNDLYKIFKQKKFHYNFKWRG
jgi:hypothetical protein